MPRFYDWAEDALWCQSRSDFVLILAAITATWLSLVLFSQISKRLTSSPLQVVIQLIHRAPLDSWQDMGVDVEGFRNTAMPQQLLNDFWVGLHL